MEEKKVKELFIEKLIDFVSRVKINSFKIIEENEEDVIVDIRNIKHYTKDILLDKNIIVSTKVIKIFNKENIENKKEIIDYINRECSNEDKSKYKYNTTIANGKQFFFNISNHARLQFVKRYFLFKREFGSCVKLFQDVELLKVINSTIQDIKKTGNIKDIEKIDQIILSLISKSSHLNDKNMGRSSDVVKFKNRDKKHPPSTRFHIHPFLFILDSDSGIITTTELYSSSFQLKFINDTVKNLKNSELKTI